MEHFELPSPPVSQDVPVKAWSAPLVLPTNHPMPADRNPMFLQNTVYQGSSGRVYSLPFIDRITTEAREHVWQAVHIDSRTIWCSDHDPMNRLKEMHGICLHPGKACIELKVRVYNRTPFIQFVLMRVPETKCKPLEEIESDLTSVEG